MSLPARGCQAPIGAAPWRLGSRTAMPAAPGSTASQRYPMVLQSGRRDRGEPRLAAALVGIARLCCSDAPRYAGPAAMASASPANRFTRAYRPLSHSGRSGAAAAVPPLYGRLVADRQSWRRRARSRASSAARHRAGGAANRHSDPARDRSGGAVGGVRSSRPTARDKRGGPAAGLRLSLPARFCKLLPRTSAGARKSRALAAAGEDARDRSPRHSVRIHRLPRLAMPQLWLGQCWGCSSLVRNGSGGLQRVRTGGVPEW